MLQPVVVNSQLKQKTMSQPSRRRREGRRLAPDYRRPTIPLTSFQSLLCSWIVFSSVWYQQYSGAVLPPSVMVLLILSVPCLIYLSHLPNQIMKLFAEVDCWSTPFQKLLIYSLQISPLQWQSFVSFQVWDLPQKYCICVANNPPLRHWYPKNRRLL